MRRPLALAASAVAAVVLGAGPALAHVRSTEPQAPAGSRYTFSFLVEHGCGESPTVGLRILLPEGAFDARPVDKPGWTAAVSGDPQVVEFSGGRLADGVKERFSVELVTPNRPGEDALFPTVQRCEVGEQAWIAIEPNVENPAPRVRLTANATPITAPPATTTTQAPTTTTAAPVTTTTEGLAPQTAGGREDGGGSGGSGGSAAPVLAALGLGGALLAALAARRLGRR